MSEKSALFMARTTRFHEFARSLTTTLGVEVSLATPDSPTAAHDFDLLILDSDGIRSDRIDQIAKWLADIHTCTNSCRNRFFHKEYLLGS